MAQVKKMDNLKNFIFHIEIDFKKNSFFKFFIKNAEFFFF